MHIHHILHSSTAPAPISESIAQQAHTLAEQLADTLEVVGLLAVEFFLTQDDQLIVNEMAPRPHNSGHYTIDACHTSQFQQHIRAITGLPMGKTDTHTPAVMINILGIYGLKPLHHGTFYLKTQARSSTFTTKAKLERAEKWDTTLY